MNAAPVAIEAKKAQCWLVLLGVCTGFGFLFLAVGKRTFCDTRVGQWPLVLFVNARIFLLQLHKPESKK